jgi:rubrerythrin
MKITRKQLKQLIKEEAQHLNEFYPIGGKETPSPDWTAFRNAAWKAAAGFIDAGMEADGIERAMIDDIQAMIREMTSEDD